MVNCAATYEIPNIFLKLESWSQRSQERANSSYSEPDKSSLIHAILSVTTTSILYTPFRLPFSSDFFLSVPPPPMSYASLFSQFLLHPLTSTSLTWSF
jgi:hypothetical protein